MKKSLIFIFLLTSFLKGVSQDTLITNKGDEVPVRVTEILGDTLFYRSYFNENDSTINAVALSEIFKIKYENGVSQLLEAKKIPADSTTAFTPTYIKFSDRYNRGLADARQYYWNNGTFNAGFACGFIGLFGVPIGLTIGVIPPAKKRLIYHDSRLLKERYKQTEQLFTDTAYILGYQKGAHKRKVQALSEGYGDGFMTSTAVSGILNLILLVATIAIIL